MRWSIPVGRRQSLLEKLTAMLAASWQNEELYQWPPSPPPPIVAPTRVPTVPSTTIPFSENRHSVGDGRNRIPVNSRCLMEIHMDGVELPPPAVLPSVPSPLPPTCAVASRPRGVNHAPLCADSSAPSTSRISPGRCAPPPSYCCPYPCPYCTLTPSLLLPLPVSLLYTLMSSSPQRSRAPPPLLLPLPVSLLYTHSLPP